MTIPIERNLLTDAFIALCECRDGRRTESLQPVIEAVAKILCDAADKHDPVVMDTAGIIVALVEPSAGGTRAAWIG